MVLAPQAPSGLIADCLVVKRRAKPDVRRILTLDFDMKTAAVLLAFAATAAAPAAAEGVFRSGGMIRDGLQGWFGSDTADSLVGDAIAAGYVLGVHDTLSGTVVCTPGDINEGEVLWQVLSFLDLHQDRMTEGADQLVAAALAERWGCN